MSAMPNQVVVIPGKKSSTLVDDNNTILSVCAYCRVSTNKNDQVNSLGAQREFFNKYFSRHKNWVSKTIFYDEGISGTSLKKKDSFNNMIEQCKAGTYQLIITKDVTRFSRNVCDAMSIIMELKNRGVYILFLSDNINTQRNEDREKLTSALTQAESESLRLSRKVSWGQHAQMEKGVIFGRREMFGYQILRDGPYGQQTIKIIPEEAEIVKQVFQMYASGMGTFRIAKDLQQRGIQTKRFAKGWSNTVILRMLRNEKYVGDLYSGKTYTPDPLTHKKCLNRGESDMVKIRDHHPKEAIIDRELWEKVQMLLAQNAPSDEAKKKHSNRYWCSGKVFCGECGQRFVSHRKPLKNGTIHKSWVCWSAQQEGNRKEKTLDTGEKIIVGCDSHSVNDRILKTGMYDIIHGFIRPHFDSIREKLEEMYRNPKDSVDTQKEILECQTEIDKKNQVLARMLLLCAENKVPDETFAMARKEINGDIIQLKEKIRNLSSQNKDIAASQALYDAKLAELDRIMQLKDDPDGDDLQRSIVENVYRSILDRIEVYNGQLLKFYFKFLSNPIILQYSTVGRGEGYQVHFEAIDDVTFEQLKSSCHSLE